ncbi:MAG: tripartite tricarboxylate transporter substrate binding protein [Burkholderiales bacterium]|nr:tripartite tricarboxylate transporter substrate binding protein [Burkholderiales bacterium]
MNRTATFVLVLFALLASSAALPAEQYPSRPIRMIVPFNAGGTATILARAIANGAEPVLNQTFVIDNRGGANGIIGTQMVVHAAPDGYTLLHVSTSIAINPSVYKSLPYDTLKDLDPVTIVARGAGYVLLGSPSFGARSVKELIEIARKPASKVAYGSGGIGNSTHLVAEMFSQAAGVKMTHVAYKGVAPAINAVLGGEVQIMFIPPTIAVAHVKAGKVRALGFTGASRWSVLPDVPTIAESGLPGFSKDSGWNAWLAPKGTPAPILRRLQQAAHVSVHSPKISKILNAGGYDPLANTPEEARKFLVSEIEVYSKIVRAVGIQPQ